MIVGEQRTEVSSEQTQTALSITSSRTTPERKGQQSFLMHSNARSYGIDMYMHIGNVREKKPKKARLRGRSESYTPELIQVIAVALAQSRVMTTVACLIEQ